jgi:phosphoglycerate dehydrogenase-like enzyme
MKIVIPDHIEMSDNVQNRLTAMGVTVHDDSPSSEQLLDRIKDAELITVNYYDLTAELIDAAPQLK